MKRHNVEMVGVFILLLTHSLQAQTWIRFEGVPEESRVTIEGTSTLHDWTVESESIKGFLEIQKDADDDALWKGESGPMRVKMRANVHVEIVVRSLKSGKGDMDKKMYKALKDSEHPKIEYRLTEAICKGSKKIRDARLSSVEFDTRGELTVAGVTLPIEMAVIVDRIGKDQLITKGETFLKMKDFKIKPPKAMLGMIRTGNDIKISFEWMTKLPVETTQTVGISQSGDA